MQNLMLAPLFSAGFVLCRLEAGRSAPCCFWSPKLLAEEQDALPDLAAWKWNAPQSCSKVRRKLYKQYEGDWAISNLVLFNSWRIGAGGVKQQNWQEMAAFYKRSCDCSVSVSSLHRSEGCKTKREACLNIARIEKETLKYNSHFRQEVKSLLSFP